MAIFGTLCNYWNIVYLEKKGWVCLSHDTNCPPFVSCYVELTTEGIDLVEDELAFEREFSKDERMKDKSGKLMNSISI